MSKKMRLVFCEVPKSKSVMIGAFFPGGQYEQLLNRDFIEGTPTEVRDGIFDKLREMGFFVEKSKVADDLYRINPPPEAEPEEPKEKLLALSTSLTNKENNKYEIFTLARKINKIIEFLNMPRKDGP